MQIRYCCCCKDITRSQLNFIFKKAETSEERNWVKYVCQTLLQHKGTHLINIASALLIN